MDGDRVLGERLAELAGDAPGLGVGAVGLGDDHEPRAVRQAERVRVAGDAQQLAVEVLDRRRHDPRREHAFDRADPGIGVGVEPDHRQLELRAPGSAAARRR